MCRGIVASLIRPSQGKNACFLAMGGGFSKGPCDSPGLEGFCSRAIAKAVDFTRKSFFRRFTIEVDDAVFYVNPHVLAQASPVFEAMLMGSNFVERTKSSATLVGETADDIHLLLKAICPTYYALYPYPVNEKTFPTLARLADKFLISGLRSACEQLILQPSIANCTVECLIRMLDSIRGCAYSGDVQQRLLLALLSKPLNELRDVRNFSASPTYTVITNSKNEWVELFYEECELLRHTVIKKEPHSNRTVIKEDIRRIYCELCSLTSRRNTQMHICSSCRRKLCLNCLNMLCPALLQQCIDNIDNYAPFS
uniref:BTB domain-containing protein n=1 Tax=Ascaris lumbricoides TaxID=6252 RepID=A0A0M3I3H1_ASCLU